MTRKPSQLDRLVIQKPCTVDWNSMSGDDQKRFCSECNKYVHNLSALTRKQAEAIVAASRGQLCARLVRDANGTTITADEWSVQLTRPEQSNRRTSPVASAVVSAILTLSPTIAAQ